MSGLAGWIDFRRDLQAQAGVVRAMTETLRHRGPDTDGTWIGQHAALGHRGLVAGPSAGEEQPCVVHTATGPVVLAYDGEIVNLPELGRAVPGPGGEAAAGSDAEVLLRCYLSWGSRLVERLDGMFAVAVWDGRTRRLHLGRDRFGIKPLYYSDYPGGLLFASEPKGIMANPLFEARLDPAAVPILLQPRLALPGETPLVGLHEVPPAHVVTGAESGTSRQRYWRLTSEPHKASFEQTAEHVRGLLEDSVARHTAGPAPLGAMLSGGVDSTSVVALAMPVFQKENPGEALDTFCIRFASDPAHFVPTELRPDLDAPYAATAAEHLGTGHHTLTATIDDLLDVLPATRRARDLPGWGQFDASMHLLFRQMRQHCRVGLSGEAADEFFGGYPYFFDPRLVRRDTFPWLGEGPRLSRCLSPELRAVVDPVEDERARYSQLLSEVPRLDGEDPENARMREVLFLGMSGPLAVILDRKERMSMAVGLQMRLPFCDSRLVEYVWNVPWSLKCRGGVKGLLKAAVGDVLPPSTLRRRKSAYPHVQDPRHEAALVRQATRAVYDDGSPIAWMFDRARLADLLRRIAADEIRSPLPGGASGAQLLIQLVEMRAWIDDYQVSVR
jgi:asparagine synthase (glutamine-hydrolysing)